MFKEGYYRAITIGILPDKDTEDKILKQSLMFVLRFSRLKEIEENLGTRLC